MAERLRSRAVGVPRERTEAPEHQWIRTHEARSASLNEAGAAVESFGYRLTMRWQPQSDGHAFPESWRRATA